MQPFGGAALAPEIIVGRVLLNQQINIAELLARLLAIGGIWVDDAVLVPPITAEEVSGDPPLKNRSPKGVVQPTKGRAAPKRGRVLEPHSPFKQSKEGL